jgi:hypothetical protein
MLIASDPAKYFKPPYVGGRGWIGVELARVSDEELDFLVRHAWRQIAPKTLQAAQVAPEGKSRKKEWAVIKHKDPKEYKKDLKLFKEAIAFVSLKDMG